MRKEGKERNVKYINMKAAAVSKDGIFTLRLEKDSCVCITRDVTCLRTRTATKVSTFPVVYACGPVEYVKKVWVKRMGQEWPA